ncbi:flavin-containing monooxygenase [Bradyrhizobium erythrophlei]|uniref:flavin-containing monooxygenase n=1 Tax=Bradyrhizobium erythrophlei TaxID=1437360 RepID=UPI0035F01090
MQRDAQEVIKKVLGKLPFDCDELKSKYDGERDKRILEQGNAQYVPTMGKFSHFDRDPWTAPGFTRPPIIEHTEVIVAGAGFGGLLAGARLREADFRDIRIVDEAGDFGGTWYWNRYPGAMCDIEAHIYLPLIEELNYAPKHRYAYAAEMLELSRNIGQHYDLYRKACFQTTITEARWIDSQRHWLIETNRGDRLTTDYLVLACGRQSLPKLPGIAGIQEFDGHAFHSSRWDYGYTGGSERDFTLTRLVDKRVAVVGTGATAIQIVPELGKWAKQLVVFQRTPSSVGVRANQQTGPDWVGEQTPGWQKRRRDNFQRLMSGLKQDVNHVNDGWTEIAGSLNPLRPNEIEERLGRKPTKEERALLGEIFDYQVMNKIRGRVDEVVKDRATAEALKPWYRWLCKRPCFHDDYLETFNRPNVILVDTQGRGVEQVTRRGIVADGSEYPVDCIVFATGFEAGISYTRLTGFELFGRDGLALSEHWRPGVRTFHGMTTDRFPNCFFMGGNQQTAAATNAVQLLDEQAIHVAYTLRRVKTLSKDYVEPTSEAVDNYVHLIRTSPKNIAQVAFYQQCTPGYYNAEGKATKSEDIFQGGRYGDGPMPFYAMLESWRADDRLDGMYLEPPRQDDVREQRSAAGQGS